MEPEKLRDYLEEVRLQELLLHENEQTIQYLMQSYKKAPDKKTIRPPFQPACKMPTAPEEPRYWGETIPGSTRKERRASRRTYLFEKDDPQLWGKERRNRECLLIVLCFLYISAHFFDIFSDFDNPALAIIVAVCLGALLIGLLIYFTLHHDFPKHNNRILMEYAEKVDLYNAQMIGYEATMESYNRRYAEYEAMLEANDRQHEQECRQVREFNVHLDERIRALRDQQPRLQQQLQKLYSVGIVHPIYQGLIPVTKFCEYLDTGRKKASEGMGALYNLYEEELTLQQITDQLRVGNKSLRSIDIGVASVGSRLTGIQRNQAMLHEEVAKGNASARELQKDTERMRQQLEAQNAHLAAISDAAETAALHAAETAKETKRIADADELRRHRELLEQ